VRAESAGVGEGATFVVRLPLAKEAGASQAREPRGRDGRVASSHVLVVDDNRDGADSLAELLTFLGHHVDVAYDGPSALEKIRTDPPNVVVCDLGLPGMSGYDVARTLRAEGSQLRLIAMSGYARPEDVLATKEAGFNAHLAKPCDVEEVERLFVS
jgi:CheY-like chemotaxis protein